MRYEARADRDAAIERLIARYPELSVCSQSIADAVERIIRCYTRNGMVLICGNGGSASDSAHIVGELMKGFRLPRPLPAGIVEALVKVDAERGARLASVLQQGLAAIDLTSQAALTTAFSNDQASEAVFAQQVLAYGRPEHVLIGLSTSGNSENVILAVCAAKALGMDTIGMTGETGGTLSTWCDVTIAVPGLDTAGVQELHLPVYHTICSIVEHHFFNEA